MARDRYDVIDYIEKRGTLKFTIIIRPKSIEKTKVSGNNETFDRLDALCPGW